MPQGKLGFRRVSDIGPLTELSPKEKLENDLQEHTTKVTDTEQYGGTRYSFRLDIPTRGRNLPSSQNIPSNMALVATPDEYTEWPVNSATLRPPNTRRSIPDIKDRIEMIVRDERFTVLVEDATGQTVRPHIFLDDGPVEVKEILSVIRRLSNQYHREFE